MTSPGTIIELDSRTTDGIEVRLLWNPAQDRVTVTASDVRSGEVLEIAVGDRERALDVFHHPYAYAAFLGIETRTDNRQLATTLTS
jgi:hypothetical protein